uniref:Methylmalonyl-CoA epimerase, mitochondrial n=1 Tax=Phallusia mammillata TaxID=59560 RepID=A0A6F9DJS5_9ASCI|nr:methylmalonyl-CoA epimerase, mitochondrial-like [Phallusia mammillata]
MIGWMQKLISPSLCSCIFKGTRKFSGVGKINHIAIAVPNLESATNLYKNVLGAKVSAAMPLPEHGVTTVFVELGDTKIELLHPLGDRSPISGFLGKNKSGGLHHICVEVENISDAVKALTDNGIRTLTEEPKIGAHGKPVMFCHPKDCDGVLLELEES